MISSISIPVFHFPTPLLTVNIKNTHSSRCEVVAHSGSNLYLLRISDTEHLFIHPLAISISLSLSHILCLYPVY